MPGQRWPLDNLFHQADAESRRTCYFISGSIGWPTLRTHSQKFLTKPDALHSAFWVVK
jgi:hypothetical protein